MTGRFDPAKQSVKKRPPTKVSARNQFYVKKKTCLAQQTKRIEELLQKEFDEVYVHGLGASLNKALTLVLELQRRSNGTLMADIQTSTVNVTDDIYSLSDEAEAGERSRPLSAVHVKLYIGVR
ncbi:unnamed protein product, partial [Mesorhabditis belari]|uniref:Ribonuclease P protein subunit p20 n=1 Tax=Mesorhabditis belari TaxID=2138241 RepID=A0AAF3FBU8_9BILA